MLALLLNIKISAVLIFVLLWVISCALIWLMHNYGKILLLILEVLYCFAVNLYEYGFI